MAHWHNTTETIETKFWKFENFQTSYFQWSFRMWCNSWHSPLLICVQLCSLMFVDVGRKIKPYYIGPIKRSNILSVLFPLSLSVNFRIRPCPCPVELCHWLSHLNIWTSSKYSQCVNDENVIYFLNWTFHIKSEGSNAYHSMNVPKDKSQLWLRWKGVTNVKIPIEK